MCFRYETWNLWKLFSVRLLDTTYATYKSTSVLFSQTLVTPPNFVCNQTQNLANTNSNIQQYLPSGHTETHRFNGNHLFHWICPWAMFEARLVAISRGSPFPYLSSQRQWRTRFWWLKQRRIRIETALRKVARKISDEPTQSDRSIGPRLHLHLARANLTRQTGLKIGCNKLELCGRTISIWANA